MSAGNANAARRANSCTIAALQESHRDEVERMLYATSVFRDDEVDVALDVFDSYLDSPDVDYFGVGAFTDGGELAGYAVYGPTPCTIGTYDLYWIAVDPTHQGNGVGRMIVDEVEARLVRTGARMLVIETSSQPMYEPTRIFYERMGYDVVARIADFYTEGDDRMIFVKRLPQQSR